MSLSVGIVGLPNVGKSTLFNALLKRQQAYVANFPFATIEPNIGVVPVPDSRLDKLASVIRDEEIKRLSNENKLNNLVTQSLNNFPPIVPATVEFVDIAGLIKGASQGEGLGNKFLSHIREVNAICHVVRSFTDPDIIKQGISDPKTDLEVVQTELALADLQTLEKQKDPGNTSDKELKKRWEIIQKFKEILSRTTSLHSDVVNDEELKIAKELGLLTVKPILVVLNVDETELRDGNKVEIKDASEVGLNPSQVVAISAKIESELSNLSETDQKTFMDELGVKASGLERLIKKAFETLGLITFLTAGEKEVRAWTLRAGSDALRASGEIHTDFIKNFIKTDICAFSDFVEAGGWKAARENGKVRSEGKEYIMRDGDVVEFRIGS